MINPPNCLIEKLEVLSILSMELFLEVKKKNDVTDLTKEFGETAGTLLYSQAHCEE